MRTEQYPEEVSDEEWEIIKAYFPKQITGRPAKYSKRSIINAIFYLLRTGCSWRHLPKEFGPWKTIYTYFRRWKLAGVFEQLYEFLRISVRKVLGKTEEGEVGIIDSQSVKITDRGGEHGYDGAKKINGRKRHILVDNLGYPIQILVTKANINDREGLIKIAESLSEKAIKLKKICRQAKCYGTCNEGPLWRLLGEKIVFYKLPNMIM